MDISSLLEIAAKAAGTGGIALIVLYSLYRVILKLKIFPKFSRNHAMIYLMTLTVLIAGITFFSLYKQFDQDGKGKELENTCYSLMEDAKDDFDNIYIPDDFDSERAKNVFQQIKNIEKDFKRLKRQCPDLSEEEIQIMDKYLTEINNLKKSIREFIK